jgi:predicted N-acyltransferase
LSFSHGLDVEIIHSVDEIGQNAWDHLSANRPFTSYRWYRFGEKIAIGDKPIYIILSQADEPVARATLWLRQEEPLPISSTTVRCLTGILLRRWPLLLCRAPWRTDISGLILPGPPLRDRALTAIAQVAWDQAQQYRASVLVFDYLQHPDMERFTWPEPFTFTPLSGPGTCLFIKWTDFESYLQDLSKSARKDHRRHHNRAAGLGIQIRRHSTVTALDEAMGLIRNVEKRHNSAPDPCACRALEHMDMLDATWLTAEMDGRLVGCGLLLGDGDSRLLTLLGLDYEVQYAYFQLIYEVIRCAIEEGVHLLRGGSGAYEIKQRLGFQLEHNNHVAFAANNRVLRWLGHRFCGS